MQNEDSLNPFDTIKEIFQEAESHISPNPLAMILATADASGRPSSRTVLLKGYDEAGFVFFTNSQSRKGRQLQQNPFASLTFYLAPIRKQIHIEGRVSQIASTQSDAYWVTRSRESQIGAWASDQSRKIPATDTFPARYQQFEKNFSGVLTIPRPAHWNGYCVSPEKIEIWFEREHRLHERFCYTKTDDTWSEARLFP